VRLARIYVYAPIGDRTGGPEALHQLVEGLSRRGVDASLLATPKTVRNPAAAEYEIYSCRVERGRVDLADSIVIVPEVMATAIQASSGPPRWMWWLSVGNSQAPAARALHADQFAAEENGVDESRFDGAFRGLAEVLRHMRHAVDHRHELRDKTAVLNQCTNHMAQSAYALEFCRASLDPSAVLVSDYLRPLQAHPAEGRAADVVVYNGARGSALIPRISRLLPEITFRPIENMSYQDVCSSLAAATAYLELGSLPGRDRLPREAARLGTPVVMLERGAGRSPADFPLGREYVVAFAPDWDVQVRDLLLSIVGDPAGTARNQEPFREWVLDDRNRFEAELDAWVAFALGT
jgi:hypothetical protein